MSVVRGPAQVASCSRCVPLPLATTLLAVNLDTRMWALLQCDAGQLASAVTCHSAFARRTSSQFSSTLRRIRVDRHPLTPQHWQSHLRTFTTATADFFFSLSLPLFRVTHPLHDDTPLLTPSFSISISPGRVCGGPIGTELLLCQPSLQNSCQKQNPCRLHPNDGPQRLGHGRNGMSFENFSNANSCCQE